MSEKVWTDYPIVGLGDVPGERAPVREAELLAWDRDKYVTARVGDVVETIKRGYFYLRPGRLGKVPHVTADILRRLPYPE